MSISLVAGLGNPGRGYVGTRHNVGWLAVEAWAVRHGLHWKAQPQFQAETARWDRAPGETCYLVKPLTFMNESGRSLGALAAFYKVPASSITAVYDDVAIDLGLVKVSVQGSAGGHNGVASLLQHLGDGFIRFRIGVGPKTPAGMDLKDFVLGKFTPEQSLTVTHTLDTILSGLDLLISSGPERAMNQLNRRVKNEPEQT